jgi:hypothetical protein
MDLAGDCFFAVFLVIVIFGSGTTRYTDREYLDIEERVRILEVQKLLTQDDKSQAGVEQRVRIDKQIAPLRGRMAELQSVHDAAETRRAVTEKAREADGSGRRDPKRARRETKAGRHREEMRRP